MKLLSDQDRTFWHKNGYVVIPDVVPTANLTAVIDAIAEFNGQEFNQAGALVPRTDGLRWNG